MKFIMAGLLSCIGITAQAQDTKVEEPKGKATIQMFGNFHTGFGSENDIVDSSWNAPISVFNRTII